LTATLAGRDQEVAMATFRGMVVHTCACDMRLKFKLNKYLTWIVSILVGFYVTPLVTATSNALGLGSLGFAWIGYVFSISDVLICFFGFQRYKDQKTANTNIVEHAKGALVGFLNLTS